MRTVEELQTVVSEQETAIAAVPGRIEAAIAAALANVPPTDLTPVYDQVVNNTDAINAIEAQTPPSAVPSPSGAAGQEFAPSTSAAPTTTIHEVTANL